MVNQIPEDRISSLPRASRGHKSPVSSHQSPRVAFSSLPPNNEHCILIPEVTMPEAVIVSAIRTPVGRAYKGSLRATRPDDLAALAIKEALARVPAVDVKQIDDVILGSAMTINRFCSSGLQAIALAAERIRGGSAEIIVAGGTESMSLVPMGGNKVSPNPWLVDHYP